MKPRRTVLVALTGVALAGAAGGAIAASSDPESEVYEKAAKALDVDAQELREALDDAREDVYGHPRGPLPVPGPRLHGPHHVVDAVANVLGLTERQVFQGLRDGRSIEELAEDNGKTLADVRAAVRAAARADLDEEVREGRLSREEADEILEHIVDGVEHSGQMRLPGRAFGLFRHGPGPPPLHGPPAIFETLADALDLDERELLQRLRDGRSIEQIARAQGKTMAELEAAVGGEVLDRLDRLRDFRGRP